MQTEIFIASFPRRGLSIVAVVPLARAGPKLGRRLVTRRPSSRYFSFFLTSSRPSSTTPSIAQSIHPQSISTRTLRPHRQHHNGCHRSLLRRRPRGRPLLPARPLRVYASPRPGPEEHPRHEQRGPQRLQEQRRPQPRPEPWHRC